MQTRLDASAIGKLRKALNKDDLHYLQSHNTKPFRLFKADTLARLPKPAGHHSDTDSAAVRRSVVTKAKTQWSALDIATKLYYCKLANCFHSKSKLRLINQCSFPQEEEEEEEKAAPTGRTPAGNTKRGSGNGKKNYNSSSNKNTALYEGNFQLQMRIVDFGNLPFQWQGFEPYNDLGFSDANGNYFNFFAESAGGNGWK